MAEPKRRIGRRRERKPTESVARTLVSKHGWGTMLKRQWQLLLLTIPFVIFILVNNYLPIWGWSYAFFEAGRDMFPDFSKFRGFEFFERVYARPALWSAVRNTFFISLLKLVLGYVGSITLALMLNEVRSRWFKKTVQTISYLPHFISWVVAATLINVTFSTEGIVNNLLVGSGILERPHNFMLENSPRFWLFIAGTDLWKSVGWNAIIYLAAMTGIDPDLYEAASIDGATRIKRIRFITLPSLWPTVRLLLVLSIGNLFTGGFEQLLLLQRPFTLEYSEIVDTFIFKLVWGNATRMNVNIPMGTAAGIANSLVSFVLIFTANRLSKRYSGEAVF